jgi:alpha-tubulin suppressor-like RCC1 family protein
MAGLSNVESLSVGDAHACAVESDGDVLCWGNNNMAQLGGGATPGPSAVPGVTGAEQVAAGRFGTCARVAAGEVKCWGYLIDSGWDAASSRPRTVTLRTVFPGGVADVSTGESAICSATSAGGVQCVGSGYLLGAGRADYDTVLTPTAAQGVTQASAVTVYSSHACAVSGGSVYCWGAAPMTATPTKVAGLTGATSVGVGRAYTCALVDSGDVMCWGENKFGELGDPTLDTTETPVRVLLPEL